MTETKTQATLARQTLAVGYKSVTGPVRKSNQDTLGAPPLYRVEQPAWEQRGHLLAVADGVGGYAGGEVASQAAMATLFQEFYSNSQPQLAARLQAAVQAANAAVLAGQANPAYFHMRTTLVAAAYRQGELVVANVGDSRAYLIRRERVRQISQDHTLAQAHRQAGLLQAGESARSGGGLLRSLGQAKALTVDLFNPAVQPGDALLLCSDGLWQVLQPADITACLRGRSPQAAAEALVGLAVQRGSQDNITAMVVYFGLAGASAVPARPARLSRLFTPTTAGLVGFILTIAVALLVIQPPVLSGLGLPRATRGPATALATPSLPLTLPGTPTLSFTQTPAPAVSGTALQPAASLTPPSTATGLPGPTDIPLPLLTASPSPTATLTPTGAPPEEPPPSPDQGSISPVSPISPPPEEKQAAPPASGVVPPTVTMTTTPTDTIESEPAGTPDEAEPPDPASPIPPAEPADPTPSGGESASSPAPPVVPAPAATPGQADDLPTQGIVQ